MKIKATPDKIIVKIKNAWNDKNEDTGLVRDISYDPYQHIKYDAIITSVPDRYEGGVINSQYKGSPPPKSYAKAPGRNLFCGTTKYNYISHEDLGMKEGDKVYFKYLALGMELMDKTSNTFLEEVDGWQYHMIFNDVLFCYVRDGKITPILGNVLVKNIEHEDVEDVEINGVMMRVKTIDGIIYETSPKPKYLEGVVHHIGEFVDGEERDVKKGDKIMYLPNSEFENKIEGEEYYVMKQWFIISKEVDGDFKPVGKFVKVKVDEDKSGLIKNPNYIEPYMTGEILEKGERAHNINEGQHVIFNNKSPYFVKYKENIIFVREEDLYGSI